MAVTLTIAGGSYPYSDSGEDNWGQQNTDAMVAVCANALWGSGGSIDYLISNGTNPASAGKLRLIKTDTIKWRNATNTADLTLDVSANRLRWEGESLAYVSATQTLISPTSANKVLIDNGSGQATDSTIAISTLATQGYPYAATGKIDIFDDYTAPSATFPYYWLGNADAIITTANWPDLVPTLRAKTLKDGGTTDAKVWITDAVVAAGGASATLTYTAFATATKGPLSARTATKLAFQLAKYTTSTGRPTITIPTGGANNVPAGTYYITAITTTEATRTIVIATASLTEDGSGAIDIGCSVYPHRVADSETAPTTKAVMFQQASGDLEYYIGPTNGVTYNGVLLTITSGASNFGFNRCVFIPYKTANGDNRLRANLSMAHDAANSFSDTIAGVTFKNSTSYSQGAAVYPHGVGGYCLENTGEIALSSAGNFTYERVSFDSELNSAPTWANFDPLPWQIINPANGGQLAYMWGKTYTP